MAQRLDVQYIRAYTDGSAARKLEVAAPKKIAKRPRGKKQKRIVIPVDPIATLGIVVAVVMLISMGLGVLRLQSAQQEAAAMEAYVSSLRAENTALHAAYDTGYDLAQVEQTAHALGLVPREQVQHVAVHIEIPQQQTQPGAWERFYTFLTGLFA